jgi:N-acetyl-anhydromuramyl-L-alanine amidase AmpD
MEVMRKRAMRILPVALAAGAVCWVSGQAEYPGAKWVPAHSSNYTTSNRPGTYPINYMIIHVTQGSYAGAISWFQNPASNVSAHFVIRSSDGEITQMLKEKDVGWHAGNWNYNTWSLGIEHEGFVNNPAWFTSTMYESSGRLTRYATKKYSIPRTRSRVIGHNEVPGATHTDPGPHWNWNLYMQLIRLEAEYSSAKFPVYLNPGESYKTAIFLRNLGDDFWSPSGSNPVRLGTANPIDHNSVFYNSRYWLSPNRPCAVNAATPVGNNGLFFVTLKAPGTPGVYTESFQLVKEGIGRFGPILTFTVSVGIQDTVHDNDGPNFEAVGSWSTGTTAPGKYGADYRFAATPTSNYANWYLDAPVSGYYDVYAWWSQGTNRSDTATYEVRTALGNFSYVVNQQANGGRWNLLGRRWIPQDDGFVRLLATGPSGKVVIADAVRFVGPYANP